MSLYVATRPIWPKKFWKKGHPMCLTNISQLHSISVQWTRIQKHLEPT